MNPATGRITQRDARFWMQGANGEWIIRPVLWNNLRMLIDSHVPLLSPIEEEIFHVARDYGADVPTVILCRREELAPRVRTAVLVVVFERDHSVAAQPPRARARIVVLPYVALC